MVRTKSSLVFVVVAAFLLGGWMSHRWARVSQVAVAQDGRPPTAAMDFATQLSEAFKFAARAVRPSVVSIESVQEVPVTTLNRGAPFSGMLDDEVLERFFGGSGDMPRRIPNGSIRKRGVGSGVVISRDGYILTNNHVVGGAKEITVTFSDGRKTTADIVGVDPKTDVAVIRVSIGGLTPARLGDSDAVEVGEWSLAVGSPLELQQSVTAGIISAVGRDTVGIADYENFLQTDAAINPGNSGGPLVNLRGEVIGINTAIASKSGGYMGIGFAIPSNMVRRVTDDLIAHGEVRRGKLGAVIQDLNPELAESFGYRSTRGALVNEVMPGGPAEAAGLQAGDIVTSINGRAVQNMSQLRNQAASSAPGSQAVLEYFRDGKSQRTRVEMGRLVDEDRQLASLPTRPRAETGERLDELEELGIAVRELTPELRSRLRPPSQLSGVVITQVRRDGAGNRAGLQPGDMITQVGSRRVQTPDQLRVALAEFGSQESVRLRVAQRTGSGYVGRFLMLRRETTR